MRLLQKIRNFISIEIIKKQEVVEVKPCTAPAPCPKCGMSIEVPLTRNPMKITCFGCKTTVTTMAIGICDLNEEKLKHVYEEVIMWVGMSNIEWKEEHSKKLH
jgi:hypothetical protein